MYSCLYICKRLIKIILKIPYSLIIAFSSKYILVNWYEHKNFGDALSPVLVATLSGKRVVNVNRIINIFSKPIYSVIGSVLTLGSRYKNLVVWGSGFIEESGKLLRKPKKVLAVRGKGTREKLINYGVKCLEVYGDPALLCPLLYTPNVTK